MAKTTIVPEINDVLFVTGRGLYGNWNGNYMFRSLVRKNKDRYHVKSNLLKLKIVEEIVDQLQLLNPPARFLKLVHADWIELDRRMAVKKTKKALRDINRNVSTAHLEARNISEQQALSINYTTGQRLAQALENDSNLTMTQNKPETEVQADDGRQKLTEDTSINVEDKKNIDHPSSVSLGRVHEALPKPFDQDAFPHLPSALPNNVQRINQIIHRDSSDKPKSELPKVITPHNTPPLTEAELLINTRVQALRKVNEMIQALKEATAAVAGSLQELGKLGLFMDMNGEIMNNPDMISPDTMLNQQQALLINYDMEQKLAIEALAKSRKSLNHVPEVNNNVSDRAIPEMIMSDSAIKYGLYDKIPECPSQDVRGDTMHSSIVSAVGNSRYMAPDVIKSEEIGNHEHDVLPNQMVSLGIETEMVPSNENTSYLFNSHKHIGNDTTP